MDIGDVNTLYAIAALLLGSHFVGDWVLQSHNMASKKSKDWGILALHVAIHTAVVTVIPLIFWILGAFSIINVLLYFVFNYVVHFIIDAITSRINSKLWMKQDWHNFFVMIGFDQLLHALTLLFSMAVLINSIVQTPSSVFSLTLL